MKFAMGLLGAAGGAFVGDYLVEQFILRDSDDSPKGFITKAAGFGVDDVLRYGVIGLLACWGMTAASKLGGK